MLLESCMVLCAFSGLVAAGVSVWSVRDLSTRVGVLERAGRLRAGDTAVFRGYPETARRPVVNTNPGLRPRQRSGSGSPPVVAGVPALTIPNVVAEKRSR